MNAITIRRAEGTDIETVKALLSAARAEALAHGYSSDDSFEKGETTVAVHEGSVVGFSSIEGSTLAHLYVGRDAQGMEVGVKLLRDVNARHPGGFRMFVFERNVPARPTNGSQSQTHQPQGEKEPDAIYVWGLPSSN